METPEPQTACYVQLNRPPRTEETLENQQRVCKELTSLLMKEIDDTFSELNIPENYRYPGVGTFTASGPESEVDELEMYLRTHNLGLIRERNLLQHRNGNSVQAQNNLQNMTQ